jgi:hypothetical protein
MLKAIFGHKKDDHFQNSECLRLPNLQEQNNIFFLIHNVLKL